MSEIYVDQMKNQEDINPTKIAILAFFSNPTSLTIMGLRNGKGFFLVEGFELNPDIDF